MSSQYVLLTAMSGQCGKPSVRRTCVDGVRPERGERVLALDAVVVEMARAARPERRARRRRSERTSTKPMPGCARSVVDQPRVQLARGARGVTRPGSRGKLISPRQPEAMTDHLGQPSDASISARDGCVERDRAAGATALGHRAHGVAGRRVVARHLGQPGAQVRQALVLAAGGGLDVVGLAARAHEVLERHPVAVEERRALRLAVVGEDDEAVRARRVGDRRLDAADLAVDLAQDGERVVALDARVVRDLVVGEERRVDDGAPGHHVADHRGDLQVALDDRRPRAHERVRCASAGCAAGRRRAPGGRRRGARAAISAIDERGRARRRVRAARSRRRSRGRSARGGCAPCSSSASSAARRRRGCSPGWRRRRAAGRGRRSGGARSPRRRAGGW